VSDSSDGPESDFTVRWQFAPGSRLKRIGERQFELHRHGIVVSIEAGANWAEAVLVEQQHDESEQRLFASLASDSLERKFAGTVSAAFRKTEWAPYLKLIARPKPGRPCVFTTSFVASAAS
jgi:hypothetical protein